MKIWDQKIYDSDPIRKSNFVIIGQHKKIGSGVLSHHIEKWHADYNAMLINSDGGKAEVKLII